MNKRLDVLICGGGACISSHSHEFKKKLLEEIEKAGLSEEINLVETGCMGPCELGPVMVVYPDGSFYIKLKEEYAAEIVQEHFLEGPAAAEAPLAGPRGAQDRRAEKAGAVLRKAAEDRPLQLRQDRSGKRRRIHRPARLRGPGHGADPDDAANR